MPSPYQSVEVVPYHVWVHQPTGRQASIHGAAPWTSETDKKNWTRKRRGWTWRSWMMSGRTSGSCTGTGPSGLSRRPRAAQRAQLVGP